MVDNTEITHLIRKLERYLVEVADDNQTEAITIAMLREKYSRTDITQVLSRTVLSPAPYNLFDKADYPPIYLETIAEVLHRYTFADFPEVAAALHHGCKADYHIIFDTLKNKFQLENDVAVRALFYGGASFHQIIPILSNAICTQRGGSLTDYADEVATVLYHALYEGTRVNIEMVKRTLRDHYSAVEKSVEYLMRTTKRSYSQAKLMVLRDKASYKQFDAFKGKDRRRNESCIVETPFKIAEDKIQKVLEYMGVSN